MISTTLRTSHTPEVCTQDREIRTETPAGRRRSRGEMAQPKLATFLHPLCFWNLLLLGRRCSANFLPFSLVARRGL